MPVSQARSNAARANGARSRGPVTPEGKARSATNSRRHGLLSSDFALRTENHETLQSLQQDYLDEWQPVGATEHDLVAEMALCRYRQMRIAAVEVAAWDLQMDKDAPQIERDFGRAPDNAVRSAIAFQNLANETRTLDLTNRYETRFHRQYMRALNELKDLQDRRMAAPASPPAAPSADTNLPNEPSAPPEPAAHLPAAALPNEPRPAAATLAPAALKPRPDTAELPNEPSKCLIETSKCTNDDDAQSTEDTPLTSPSSRYYVVLSTGLEA